jgi:hypothetical protein
MIVLPVKREQKITGDFLRRLQVRAFDRDQQRPMARLYARVGSGAPVHLHRLRSPRRRCQAGL